MKYLIVVEDQDKLRIIKEVSEQENFFPYKIVGYREFLRHFLFDYDEKTVVYLMREYQITKEIAEIYLNHLYDIFDATQTDNTKIEFLRTMKEKLVQEHLLILNKQWKSNLKNKKIIFYHIAFQDKFFKKIVQQCQEITSVSVLDASPSSPRANTVYKGKNMKEEVVFVLSKIQELLKKEVPLEKIYLANLNQEYRFLFQKYSSFFHVPLELKEADFIASNTLVTRFINNYDLGVNQALSDISTFVKTENEQQIIDQIVNICNRYAFIKKEEDKKELILSDLKRTQRKKDKKSLAIHEIDFLKEEIKEDNYIFLVGANEGEFPRLMKDEAYLTDHEWALLKLDLVRERNHLSKEVLLKRLQNYSNITITFKEKQGKIEYYPSSIFEETDYCIEPIPKHDYKSSHKYNQLTLGAMWDNYLRYGTIDTNFADLKETYKDFSYQTYQNEFQKFPTNFENQNEIKLSYSNLDTFFRCSFRYYVENVLKLNKYEETFSKNIGLLFHKILEKSYEENFDFETTWIEETKDYQNCSKRELFFLNKLKKELQFVLANIQEREKELDFNVEREKRISINLEDKIHLTGIFDKILWKPYQDKTLISIIDYKTGNPVSTFDNIVYGMNLQLPIYLYLSKQLSFPSPFILGVYLDKILPSIPERDKIHTLEELKKKRLLLQGYSTSNQELLRQFDPSFEDSKRISSMKVSSKGFYPYSKVLDQEQMDKISSIAEEKIKEGLEQIKQSKFTINPKRIGTQLVGCDYCEFQDICFKKEKDIMNLKERKIKDILGGEENANMDCRAK